MEPCVSIVLLAAIACHASAGPRRDRLEARRAARPSADTPLPAGVKVLRDVAYGSDRAQRFDVYIPKDAARAPVIFMVHGGGWARS